MSGSERPDARRRLRDLMHEALHLAPDIPLLTALSVMTGESASAVVAVLDGRPTGLFSERDAVRLCLDSDVSEMLLGEACDGPPLTASAYTDFVEAYRLMLSAGARHLVVVDQNGMLLGVVGESDLVGHFGIEHYAHLDSVSRLMSSSVVTLGPEDSLRHAAQVLKRHSIGSVVIEQAQGPVGIVTLTDLVRALAACRDLEQTRLAEVMSSELITVDAEDSVFAAARRMHDARVRHLVVLRDNRTAGVLAEHDILLTLENRYAEVLRRIIDKQAREIDTHRRQLHERDLLDHLLSRSQGLGLVLVHRDGHIRFANRAVARLLGTSPGEAANLEDLLARLEPRNQRTLCRMVADAVRGETTLRLEEPDRDIGVRLIGIAAAGDPADLPAALLILNDETLARRAGEMLEFNQQVLSEMPQMVMWVDADGTIVHANGALHRALDHPPGTLLGSPAAALFTEVPLWQAARGDPTASGGQQVLRSSLRTRDQRLIPVEVFSSHLVFRGRDYFGGFIHDLTAQQVVERALAESQQRLLALVQASPDFIAVKDGDNRWQVANRAGLEMFGLTGFDYQDRSDEELSRQCPPAYADGLLRCARTCAQAWLARKPLRAIHALPHPDGGKRYLDMIEVPVFDDDGTRKALVVIGRDVTDRIRAERQRDASDERLRAAVAAMDDLLLVLDAHHCFVDHYPRSSEALRLHSGRPLVGLPVEAGLPAHVVALYEQAAARLAVGGRPQGFDYALPDEHGAERWFSARLTAQSAGGLENTGFTLLVRDISEQKAAEAHIRELNESLEERVAQRTGEMQSALSELESFSYSISHDLRTPLRAIEGFGRLLETDYGELFDDAGRDYLARIRQAAQRMANLIDDLLDLARLSRKSLQRQPVDLSALATDIVEELRQRHPARQLAVDIQPGMHCEGDPLLMRVVFDNLLGNAWKFTSSTADARIRVGSEREPDGEWFYVRDNGAGFDMAYQDRLFKPFQRLHSQAEFEGTGIGLATIHRIVARHGGSVSAEGRPGEGACFRFRLGD